MTFTSNTDFRFCVVLLLLVNVASKFGDALAPSLVDTSPLLLIALNANDLHLALTAAGHQANPVGWVPYFIVGVARRLLEDPLYYYLGWMYGTKAVDWLEVRDRVSMRNFAPGAATSFPLEPRLSTACNHTSYYFSDFAPSTDTLFHHSLGWITVNLEQASSSPFMID